MPAKPYTQQLRKCQGPCGRMTRNTKMSKANFPGTVTRGNATHCTTCMRYMSEEEQQAVAPSAAALARKEALAAERLAAAEQVRLTVARQRAERQARSRVRRVSMGQSMVRI